MFLLRNITVIFLSTFFISGCATTQDQQSNEYSAQSDIQLCKSYFGEYDVLMSEDLTSLDVKKKQYLVKLLDQINKRGLSREHCQYILGDTP